MIKPRPLATMVMALAAVDVMTWTVAAGERFPTPGLLVAYSLAFSQVSLIAIWVALGSARASIRIGGLALTIALATLALNMLNENGWLWTYLVGVQVAFVCGPLLIARRIGVRVVQTQGQTPTIARRQWQFSLRRLFLLITAVAVVLAIARAIEPTLFTRDRLTEGLLIGSCFSLVSLSSLWCTLWNPKPTLSIPLTVALSAAVGLTLGAITSATDGKWHAFLTILQTMFLIGVLLVLRVHKFALARLTTAWLLILAFGVPLLAQATDDNAEEGRVLRGHLGAVLMGNFTPDGERAVTVSSDGTAILWDMATLAPLRRYQGHTGPVYCLAISGNGRALVTGSNDNTLRLWDIPSARPVRWLAAHEGSARSLAISPDSRTVVSVAADQSVGVWNTALLDQNPLPTKQSGHNTEVTSAAFRDDGTLYATGDAAGRVILWSPLLETPQEAIGAHAGGVRKLEFTPGNQQLVSAGDDGILKVWQLPTPAPRTLATLPAEVTVAGVAVREGTAVVAASDGTLRAYDALGGQLVREFPKADTALTAVVVANGTATVAAADAMGRVRLFNLADGADRGQLYTGRHEASKVDPAIRGVAFHADNDRLATAGADGTVRLWQMPQPSLPLAGHSQAIRAMAAAHAGQWLATVSDDLSTRLWAPTGQPVRQLSNHLLPIQAVAASGDDSMLATGDAGGTVWLWNPNDGTALGTLLAHEKPVRAIAFGRGGGNLTTTSDDGTLKTWRLPLVAPRVGTGHGQAVTSVAIAADNRLAVSGSLDQTVRAWDLTSGQQVRAFEGQLGAVNGVAISSDAQLTAAVGESGVLHVWNMETGALRHRLIGMAGAMLDVSFQAGGDLLASVDADQRLRIWRRVEDRRELLTVGGPCAVAAAARDGRKIAIGGQSSGAGAVFVLDRESGELLATLVGHEGAISALAFDPTGRRLISGSADRTVRVWDLADGAPREIHKQAGFPGAVRAVALSDDGTLAFASGSENEIRQWKIVEVSEPRLIAGHTSAVGALLVRGESLFSAGDDGTVRHWQTTDGAAVRSLAHGGVVRSIDVNADGTRLVSGGTDAAAKIWNTADGALVTTLPAAPAETAVRFSPDAQTIAMCSQDGVRLWSSDGRPLERLESAVLTTDGVAWAKDGRSLVLCRQDGKIERQEITIQRVIALPEPGTTEVVFSRDGKEVFTSGAGKTVHVWSLADGQRLRTLSGPTDVVTSLSVSGDGSRLAASSIDRSVYAWDLLAPAAPQPDLSVPASHVYQHAAAMRDVALSNDGSRLAAAGDDFAVHVWDITSGEKVERLAGHAQAISAVAISNDGRTIVSGGQDSTLRAWNPAADRVVTVSPTKEPVTHVVALAQGTAALAASGANVLRWNANLEPLDSLVPPAGPLTFITSSADGEQILGVTGGTGYLWSAGDGRLLAQLALEGNVTSAAFSPDGKELAVADGQMRIRVFSLDPFRLLEEVPTTMPAFEAAWLGAEKRLLAVRGSAPESAIVRRGLVRLWDGLVGGATAVAFSPDGTQLLAGAANGEFRRWNLDGAQAGDVLATHRGAVSQITVLPDQQHVLSASADGTVRLSNLGTLTVTATFAHPMSVLSAATSPDGTKVATAAMDGVIRVWDAPSRQLWQWFDGHTKAAVSVWFLNDGQTLVSGSADGSVRAWKLSLTRLVDAHDGPVLDMALIFGGSQALTCGADGRLIISDLNSGQLVRMLKGHGARPTAVAARRDSQRVAAGTAAGTLGIWNPSDGVKLDELELRAKITSMAYSPDNQKLAVTDRDAVLSIFGPSDPLQPSSDLALHQSMTAEAPFTRIAFAADSRTVWGTHESGHLSQWAYASPAQVQQFNHGGPVYGVAITRDGSTIVSCSADQTVRVWDAATGQQRAELRGHQAAVHAVTLTADEALAVSAGADQTLRLWDIIGGRQLKQLAKTEATVYALSVHPQAQLVAAAGADRTVTVFDVLTGSSQIAGMMHSDYIHGLTYNPSGTRLVSYGYAGFLKVWNAADGRSLFERRVGRVGNFASYSPDGTRVLLSNGDATARVIELPPEAR